MIKCFRSKIALSLMVVVPLATVGITQVAVSGTVLPGSSGRGDARLLARDGSPIAGSLSDTDTITMKDRKGNDVLYKAGPAYSPKATCGQCHDYTAINKAYHFMQGALPGSAIDTEVNKAGMGVSDLWSSENQGGTAYKYLSNAYGHLLSGGQYGAW